MLTTPPLTYVAFPDADGRDASFYLAAEEYLARETDADECFFMWQVPPSVVFGRNQLIEAEVNVDYCRRHHIRLCRRKSGGGCIYADKGNVMFSYVCRNENVAETFARCLRGVADALRALGVAAEISGRNDILIEGRKVSGTAFYLLPGHSIVHGTMLYDTDMRHMAGSLSPSTDKLKSNGVESVRQRVALLKDYIDIDLEAFKEHMRRHLCARTMTLTDADVSRIEQIELEYRSPGFLYDANPPYTVIRRRYIDGCGTIEARLVVKRGRIHAVDFTGDFFALADLAPLRAALAGCRLQPAALEAAMAATPPGNYIRNLTAPDLANLLIQDFP